MQPWLLLAVALLSLGGCGLDNAIGRMEAANDRKQCTGFGFAPGTEAFSNCMMQQSAQRAEADQRLQDRIELEDAVGKSRRR